MGSWYLSLGISIVLVLIGLYTHWLIGAFGAALPFVVLALFILRRRNSPHE